MPVRSCLGLPRWSRSAGPSAALLPVAVYSPLTTVPTAGANDHVAAVLVIPVIVALNWLN
jgi:hypothetical protein